MSSLKDALLNAGFTTQDQDELEQDRGEVTTEAKRSKTYAKLKLGKKSKSRIRNRSYHRIEQAIHQVESRSDAPAPELMDSSLPNPRAMVEEISEQLPEEFEHPAEENEIPQEYYQEESEQLFPPDDEDEDEPEYLYPPDPDSEIEEEDDYEEEEEGAAEERAEIENEPATLHNIQWILSEEQEEVRLLDDATNLVEYSVKLARKVNVLEAQAEQMKEMIVELTKGQSQLAELKEYVDQVATAQTQMMIQPAPTQQYHQQVANGPPLPLYTGGNNAPGLKLVSRSRPRQRGHYRDLRDKYKQRKIIF